MVQRLITQRVRKQPHAMEVSLPLAMLASVSRLQVGKRSSKYTRQMVTHGVVERDMKIFVGYATMHQPAPSVEVPKKDFLKLSINSGITNI